MTANGTGTDTNDSWALASHATGLTAFSMGGWQLALWATAYLALVLVAVTGNATVIWIVLAHPQMRTVTNYFIVNLALSDLCTATFNTAFNFVYASHNVWYFGRAFCYFQNLFPITAVFVSIYSMTAIAAERYMAIVHPFQPRLSALATRAVIAGIWLVALALAFPQCLYSTITQDQGATKCLVAWPEDGGGKTPLLYHLVVIAAIYVLPLLAMLAAYSVIGFTLWKRPVAVAGRQVHGAASWRRLRAKKKFVKAMVLAVGTFAVCWLPYHLYFLLGHFQDGIYRHGFIQQLYLALFWLAMSSTMHNPIIYCCLNRRFRSGFRLAFHCCPWVTPREEDKMELTHTASVSLRATRRSTKEIFFMVGAVVPSETPQDGGPTKL
ncbi:substance-K receptor [Suncus etruscus]|uniref:substance-K receptor n=1 Tax=Suncus etruscus TaxID=109475 RepID=UPI002110A393|nr:substance-K receptor [Suncus etruscus]